MKHRYLFFLFAILILGSCSSGKKALESGNYYEASLTAINRLRQNPDHKKSQQTLRASYPLAVETIEMETRNRLASNAPFKYRDVLLGYQRINYLGEQIQRSPGALSVIKNPVNYSHKIPEMKERAAEESYVAAMDALSRDTREDAKNAYLLFANVQDYIPGYKDVVEKMEESLFKATLKVVVDQIPVPTAYNLSADFFQDKVQEYLHNQYGGNPFVRFYTPQEAEAEQLPYVDQYLRIQFDDFVVGETHIRQNTETFSKDSVVVGSVTMEDGSKVNVYNTVKAKMTTWRKELRSSGLVSMQVFDANSNALVTHQKFNGEFVWWTEWGNFNGDERALTTEQVKVCNSVEANPPNPQDLFLEFTRPIYSQLVPALDNFYRRY